ncbi:hypothetical protein BJX68DRAFT_83290 [Aspergillus pseudodeflectus]|uniref:Secreted protein n=1 Tax=Aspergillus pseudodeflectus TaxID=176178 RepID=A0ABR4LA64_9EURO
MAASKKVLRFFLPTYFANFFSCFFSNLASFCFSSFSVSLLLFLECQHFGTTRRNMVRTNLAPLHLSSLLYMVRARLCLPRVAWGNSLRGTSVDVILSWRGARRDDGNNCRFREGWIS